MLKNLTFGWNGKGFTLAEVLITLAIVGVVAAITIPHLINNIQDKQFRESAKEAFSKASQSIQQLKMDSGGTLSYYMTNGGTLQPALIPYFKIADTCSPNCVANTNPSPDYKTLSGAQAQTNWFAKQFITTDGMLWGIYNNGTISIIIVDVNGHKKGPNVLGRDTFAFQIYNENLLPMGATNTNLDASTYCSRSGGTYNQGYACMQFVMSGMDY